jgi:hypothetical protein
MRCAVALAGLALAAVAHAGPSGSSEELFAPTRTVEGRSFVITGAGAHHVEDQPKQYDMALYVDELDARRAFPALVTRAGGRTRAKLLGSDHSQEFLVWGRFSKLAVLRFARPLEASALTGPLKATLDDELGDKITPEMHKQVEALVALFDHDVQEGQELYLRTDGEGHIEVEFVGQKKAGPQSPKLVRALWNAWLGPKTMSKELQRALIEKIDLLGR